MATPFEYDNFPEEITADPLTHRAEIFEMLTEAIKDDRYIAAQAHAGYLHNRKDYLDFQPLGTAQRDYLQNDDMLIQFSIRIGRHDAEEIGLIDLESTIIAETDAANAEALEEKAMRLAAAAEAASQAAHEAARAARAARGK